MKRAAIIVTVATFLLSGLGTSPGGASVPLLQFNCSLTPTTSVNPVGTDHTVTYTLTQMGMPMPGEHIQFVIVTGPNAGQSGMGTTDGSGQVSFTYTSNGLPGTDTIEAGIVPNGFFCNATATKTWNQSPVARCQNVTVSAGASCTAPASIDNGSFDPDPGNTITLSQDPPGPYPLGNTPVTLTVTDNHGASSQCTGTVAVVDTTPPTLTCPEDIMVEIADPNGIAVTFTPTATDNCTPGPMVNCLPPSGSTFPRGITTVICTVTDASGNQTTCTFTVTVRAPGEGILVRRDTGGTVTELPTGASIEIPAFTLNADALVRVLSLDSLAKLRQSDNGCGATIEPGETLPAVSGFVRATQVIRYEAQPCETLAFGPGARITLPLLRSRFPNGLPIGSSLRLFELARSGGQLVFLDTGIMARVTRPGRSPGFGDFVTVPDIQVFSTFAVFQPVNSSTEALTITQQPMSGRLYFPVITQQSDQQTRISIANPDPAAALNVTFTAYNEAGTVMGTQSRTVAANRQASFLVSDLFPGFTGGAIVAVGQGGAMTGFYEIADNLQSPTMLGGAAGIQTPQQAIIFPIIKSLGGGFTEVRVFNPNASPASITLAGFTASGNRIHPTNMAGQRPDTIMLPPFGTLVVSSREPPSTYDVRLDFANLEGGYIIVRTTDGQAVVGGEIFGEMATGQQILGVLNGLLFPSGCLTSTTDPCACHVDTSPESPVPSAIRQHTLYATYFEDSPTEAILYLVNVSDRPTPMAISVFSEQGQFLKTVPPKDYMTANPHQVIQASVMSLFGFNPGAGYMRVEDPNSSLVGCVINRVSGKYLTAVPLVPDDPRLTQTPTSTFFSRIQLDPASANPRLTTGMLIFNRNNNPIQFMITVTDAGGTTRQSPVQTLAARGTYVRVRQSLSALFPSISSGFARVQVTALPGPGQGGRLIPVVVYRSNNVVSSVPQQDRQP